jgi:hypothetical protein
LECGGVTPLSPFPSSEDPRQASEQTSSRAARPGTPNQNDDSIWKPPENKPASSFPRRVSFLATPTIRAAQLAIASFAIHIYGPSCRDALQFSHESALPPALRDPRLIGHPYFGLHPFSTTVPAAEDLRELRKQDNADSAFTMGTAHNANP